MTNNRKMSKQWKAIRMNERQWKLKRANVDADETRHDGDGCLVTEDGLEL